MASYSVSSTEVGVHNKTLVASTVDTVTIDRDANTVEVVNLDGAAAIYFTVDGTTTPTVAGNGTFVIPAAVAAREVEIRTGGDTVVKLISSGTPSYSVIASGAG